MKQLENALGSIIGGVLIAWGGSEPHAVFRSLMNVRFTGARVGVDAFRPAIKALTEMGYLTRKDGISHQGPFHEGRDDLHRMAGRWWPTAKLLEAASEHGLAPENVKAAFRSDYGEKAPPLPDNVLQMKHTRHARLPNGKEVAIETDIPIPPSDRAGQLRRQAVERDNTEAARHDVRGCLPPRWIERHECWAPHFVSDWRLHARRYSVGRDGHYQGLSEEARKGITIDGEPVIELDIKASHLTIVHGLFKVPLPPGDLYHVEGLSRATVKAWIVQTLGSGRLRTRWGQRTPEEVRVVPHQVATKLILGRYPFLADLSPLIPTRYRQHPEPWRLLPHILMAKEAAALAIAAKHVKAEMPDVLVLPMHDALIVPWSAETVARQGLLAGFRDAAGVTPRIEPEGSIRTKRPAWPSDEVARKRDRGRDETEEAEGARQRGEDDKWLA
jgi:hypothetical protein